MNQTIYLAIALSGIAIGLVLFLFSWLHIRNKKNALEKERGKILEDARKDASYGKDAPRSTISIRGFGTKKNLSIERLISSKKESRTYQNVRKTIPNKNGAFMTKRHITTN
jgi:hypothetical protein